mmetsp:Transcript_22905/g.59617  ORF Transcript_22905/g.59617 Transcript_22905/m.59617 type:complete len:203 (-) Transcript_22905:632-1240(-)
MVLATSHAALVGSMQLASSARRAIVVCDPSGTVWLVAAAWAAALCGRLEAVHEAAPPGPAVLILRRHSRDSHPGAVRQRALPATMPATATAWLSMLVCIGNLPSTFSCTARDYAARTLRSVPVQSTPAAGFAVLVGKPSATTRPARAALHVASLVYPAHPACARALPLVDEQGERPRHVAVDLSPLGASSTRSGNTPVALCK